MKRISCLQADYPALLNQIYDPPKIIFTVGENLRADAKYVAIVGTRMPSEYGRKIAYKISEVITECGGIVVSGLAFGVDAICHQAAVDLKKPTVAVIASGLSNITPSSHINLAKSIVANGGTIVSEYADTNPSFKYRYLRRNRIISGLCSATIVIEAKERSGALITARHAFEQNRDVYALIGDITRPQAQGCLNLVRYDMAKPIINIDHLLECIGFNKVESIKANFDINTISVMNALKIKPLSSDELILNTKLSAPEINAAMTILEINSLINQNQNGIWSLKSD